MNLFIYSLDSFKVVDLMKWSEWWYYSIFDYKVLIRIIGVCWLLVFEVIVGDELDGVGLVEKVGFLFLGRLN